VWAAATPGSAALRPAPAMITFSPRERASRQYSATRTGSRWADMTSISNETSASSSTLPAFSIVSRSDLEPMMIPTSGPSGAVSVNCGAGWVCVSN
jgi:hypothetical protein